MFKLGVISDEIARDPVFSIPAAHEMGFTHIEFNQIREKNIHKLSNYEILELKDLVQTHQLKVIAIDPPAYKGIQLESINKSQLPNDPEIIQHLNQIRRSAEIANILGAKIVRIYSFRRSYMQNVFGNPSPRIENGGLIPPEILEKIIVGLSLALPIAEKYDIILGLENVRSCWGNTGYNSAQILGLIDHPRLRAIWDPGNDYVSGGIPYPDGYESIKPFIDHIHVKDAIVIDPSTGLTNWSCIGTGAIDYNSQISALKKDSYEKVISVETHWRKPYKSSSGQTSIDEGVQSTRETFEGLKKFLK